MATAAEAKGAAEHTFLARKKPKVSELPLSSAKRASIDGLLHTFKKKGEFDALRKRTWAQFEEGVRCFISTLNKAKRIHNSYP